MEEIIILGQGGHAGSLVDILERENKYRIAGYVVNNGGTPDGRYPIIGCDDDLADIFRSGVTNAAMGIGYMGKSNLREKLWEQLKKIGFRFPVICDPSSIVVNSAQIGEGCFIGKGAVINVNASIGKMCIINTGAIIEHDCFVDDFSHISVSTVLCGNVKIGKSSFVGANATIIQGRAIGDNCIVGAGTVVRENVEDNNMFSSNDGYNSSEGGGYKPIEVICCYGGLTA